MYRKIVIPRRDLFAWDQSLRSPALLPLLLQGILPAVSFSYILLGEGNAHSL